jgi:hypothetical protein
MLQFAKFDRGATVFPKSSSTLKLGDYCAIPRSDGKVVLFAYLCAVPNKRSYIYAGLFRPALEASVLPIIPDGMTLDDFALVHVQCFRENNTPVIGNAASSIGSALFELVKRSSIDFGVGAKHKVWGSHTIVRRAQSI